MHVGPESVGYKLPEKALVFGGDTATATDYTVAGALDVAIGEPSKVRGKLSDDDVAAFKTETKRMLESIIDTMKTSPEDLPVLLVGGGAIIAPDELKGASRVIKPQWSGVANAIGAAMARVSAVVDTVKSTEEKGAKEIQAEIEEEARQKTIEAGASAESVDIVEVESLPLPYIAHKSRFIVRAAGNFDYTRSADFAQQHVSADTEDRRQSAPQQERDSDPPSTDSDAIEADPAVDVDFSTYGPKVIDREWHISETDLQWITIGCYILGTGGGGSPYSTMLRVRQMLRAGANIRVVSPDDLKDDDRIGSGGGAGSPTVGIEKLSADEYVPSTYCLLSLFQRTNKLCLG